MASSPTPSGLYASVPVCRTRKRGSSTQAFLIRPLSEARPRRWPLIGPTLRLPHVAFGAVAGGWWLVVGDAEARSAPVLKFIPVMGTALCPLKHYGIEWLCIRKSELCLSRPFRSSDLGTETNRLHCFRTSMLQAMKQSPAFRG